MHNTTKQYQNVERLVVKVGTGYLFDKCSDGGYEFRSDQMDAVTGEVHVLSKEMDIAVVSSGAIATTVWRR